MQINELTEKYRTYLNLSLDAMANNQRSAIILQGQIYLDLSTSDANISRSHIHSSINYVKKANQAVLSQSTHQKNIMINLKDLTIHLDVSKWPSKFWHILLRNN